MTDRLHVYTYFFSVVVTSPTVFAAQVSPVPASKVLTAPATLDKPLAAVVVQKPDLAVKGMRLDAQCRVVVSVVNNGPGAVPDSVWTVKTPTSSSVYLTINGASWGGGTIWNFDPGKALQKSGGTAEYASSYQVKTSATVQAAVDHTQQVAETNETNNALTQKLSCLSIKPGTAVLAPLGGLKVNPGAGTGGDAPPVTGGEEGSAYPTDAGGAPAPMLPMPAGGGAMAPQGALPPPPQDVPPAPVKESKAVEPGELLIVSSSMGEAQQLAQQLQALGLGVKRRTNLSGLGFVVTVIRVPKEVGVGNALLSLRQTLPNAWADANHRFAMQGDPGAQYGRKLVGLEKPNPFCGAGVRIGLVDTALDLSHPALRGRDIVARSFVTTGITEANPDHGTATASLLVANPQTSGLSGLVPAAKLFVAGVFRKVSDREADTTAESIINALDWLASQNVQIVNLSLGGPRNLLVEAALERLLARGVGIVAAAGNLGPEAPPVYPAAQKGVAAVTAVDADLKPYKRANRGEYIALAAPGVDVWAAAPNKDGAYVSGTSYAAPFVTAAFAIARASNSKLPVRDIQATLAKKAKDLGDAGKDPVFGWGLLQGSPCAVAGGKR
jgi:hypothetical protein